MPPETHFAENDGVGIAYQALGEGSIDMVVIPGQWPNLDIFGRNREHTVEILTPPDYSEAAISGLETEGVI
ncbi:MAG: hypothetical protein PVI79_02945 [Gammaproteobacteria bacterium]|jgi:hypothetical protein